MLSTKGIAKLLDAKNPDEVKLCLDKIYAFLQDINQLTIAAAEVSTVTVQRGVITIASGNTSGTATITAVDMTKAEVRMLGFTTVYPGALPSATFPKLVLTDSTTVTADRNTASANDSLVSFEVVEHG